eukprot:668850_1
MCALTTDESQKVNIDMPDFADDDHDQDASEKRKLNHQDTELETSKVLPDETLRAVSPTPSVQSYHPDNLTQDIEDSSDSTYRLNSVTTAVNASLVVNIALLFSKVVVFILTFSYAVAGYYPHLSWLDPAGAVVISFWIIWSWYLTGKDEVRKLVGRRASDESLDELRTICENHHPDADLDVLIGYHIGRNILVEVEMIMEKTTTLEMSHDVCIELQFQLEKFEYVERAFVHCDYMHRGYSEHKPPTLQLI